MRKNYKKIDKYGYRVGIVGCGNIAHVQAKYILENIEKENLALCDSNPIRMEFLSRQTGVNNCFNDLASMLNEFSPDIVHILTPPQTHKKIALECLRHNSHLFIEKPVCLSTEETKEIKSASVNAGRLVCIDHFLPFDPLILKTKELIRTGILGDLQCLKIVDLRNYFGMKKEKMVPAWMEDLPGELLFDILPHHLSILNTFLPELSFSGITCHGPAQDITEMICLFGSGLKTAVIHASTQNTHRREYYIRFDCTKGCIIVDIKNRSMTARKTGQFQGIIEELYQGAATVKELIVKIIEIIPRRLAPQTSYVAMGFVIERFYRAIKEGLHPPVSCDDGIKVMEQIREIFEGVADSRISKTKPHPQHQTDGGLSQKILTADILVTGGTGFIGRRLIKRLLENGSKVRLLTRRSPEELHPEITSSPAVEVIRGSISNLHTVEKACTGIQSVFHLAAATTGGWMHHLDATVSGTDNVMKAIYPAGCRRLIYVSTIALLYHSKYPSRTVIHESFPYEEEPEKRGPYCYAKLWAEKIVRSSMSNSSDIPITIMRPGLVYGADKIPVNNFPTSKGRIRIIQGSGKRILPLVYVDNLVEALVRSLNSTQHGIYNVIDKEVITIREQIKKYEQLTGDTSHAIFLPIPLLLSLYWPLEKVRNYFAREPVYPSYRLLSLLKSPIHSSEKIKKELGWTQKIDFDQGMKMSTNNT